jgi:hypothetical protein
MKKTIYGGGTPDSEIKALASMHTHHVVALKLMENLREINFIKLIGKTFIDIGSGPSPMMSLFVFSLGCSKYVAIDRMKVLDSLKNFYLKMKSSITNYLFGKMKFEPMSNLTRETIDNLNSDYEFEDIVFHTQMVLMHIHDQDKRKKIIKSILKRGKIALFTEPNWDSLDYNEGLLLDFRNAMNEFFQYVGIDGNYGANLFDEINEVISENNLSIFPFQINITVNDEEVGMKCYNELILHAERAILALTGKFNKPANDDLVLRLKEIKAKLKIEMPVSNRPIFISVATKSLAD